MTFRELHTKIISRFSTMLDDPQASRRLGLKLFLDQFSGCSNLRDVEALIEDQEHILAHIVKRSESSDIYQKNKYALSMAILARDIVRASMNLPTSTQAKSIFSKIQEDV